MYIKYVYFITIQKKKKERKGNRMAKKELNPFPPACFCQRTLVSGFQEEASLIKSILAMRGSPRSGSFLI